VAILSKSKLRSTRRRIWLRDLQAAGQQNKYDQAFASIEAKSQEVDVTLGAHLHLRIITSFTHKIFAQELTSLRRTYGKDRALTYILNIQQVASHAKKKS